MVVGDTPLDVAAAKANGFEAFAVATGGVPLDVLLASRPEHAFESLASNGALARLFSGGPAAE